jgi:hypothetical protein
MEQEFYKFLVEHGVLFQFIQNLDNTPFEKFIKEKTRVPQSYITLAFFWENTKEGEQYWSELSDKWNAILIKIKERNNLKTRNSQCTKI